MPTWGPEYLLATWTLCGMIRGRNQRASSKPFSTDFRTNCTSPRNLDRDFCPSFEKARRACYTMHSPLMLTIRKQRKSPQFQMARCAHYTMHALPMNMASCQENRWGHHKEPPRLTSSTVHHSSLFEVPENPTIA